MESLKKVLYEGALTLVSAVVSCLCRAEGNLQLSSVENLVGSQSEISFTFYVSHPVHMQHICPYPVHMQHICPTHIVILFN